MDARSLRVQFAEYAKMNDALLQELSQLKAGKLRVFQRRKNTTQLHDRTEDQIALIERAIASSKVIMAALAAAI